MTISDNSHVVFHFDLLDEKGNLIDSSRKDVPSEYIAGSGNIIEGLEDAMKGRKALDSFTATVSPEKGYGLRNESMVFPVPQNILMKSLPQAKIGDTVMMTNGGNPIRANITAMDGENVTLDANHPLAGRTLTFNIDIVSVREATAEEMKSLHHHHDECGCGHDH